jgi:hypothetical protein
VLDYEIAEAIAGQKQITNLSESKASARLLQVLTTNRDRLRAYAVSYINWNDPSEALQLAGAKRRGEIDSQQS